jgi:hypothetical protein
MKPLARSFTALLPALALTFSLALLLAITGAYFYGYKHAARGSGSLYLGTTTTGFVIQSRSFLRFAFMSAGLRTLTPITVLNAPGHFVNLPISYLVTRGPFWSPYLLGPAAWHCLIYPFFALPAWCFVGFGIDALLGRKRIRTTYSALSVFLAILFGTFAGVLWFGLAKDPGLVPGLAEGFTLWTLLFAIPFAAWLKQKFASSHRAAISGHPFAS